MSSIPWSYFVIGLMIGLGVGVVAGWLLRGALGAATDDPRP